MASKRLSILTLNARGLRDSNKRSNLFYWLKLKQADITFLQETYWTNDLTNKIKQEWAGELFLSPGTQHSKGTAILFKTNTSIKLLNKHISEDGRIILINVQIEDKTFTLVNIYAPNSTTERKTFFNKIHKWLRQFSLNEQNVIIGGDFNYTHDPILDRQNNKYDKNLDQSKHSFESLLTSFKLRDNWRDTHPQKRQYTFKEISRIDKFLISDECMQYAQNSNIITAGIKSDHKCVQIHIDISGNKRGPGTWKLNVSILNDKPYISNIQKTIADTKIKNKNLSHQAIWELCKIKIRESTIAYCQKKSHIRKNIIKNLEDKIKQLDEKIIITNYNNAHIRQRDKLTDDLHYLVQKQKEGAKIRSRAKWLEEGEKSTKYFLNLEKKRVTTNTIKSLQKDDGTFTQSDIEILNEQHKFYSKLYEEKQTNENIDEYLNETTVRELKENEQMLLEGEIRETECKDAMCKMKLNKSPGSDGLPFEFYQVFWDEISQLVIRSLNEAYIKGELSPSQSRGVLTLIHKKMKKLS